MDTCTYRLFEDFPCSLSNFHLRLKLIVFNCFDNIPSKWFSFPWKLPTFQRFRRSSPAKRKFVGVPGLSNENFVFVFRYSKKSETFLNIGEAVLTSTHNLCFGAKIRKIGIPLQTPVLLYKSGV